MVKHKHYTIMETTEKKKHKGGYELLKEKYAKLEAHAEELQKDLDFALEKAKKERDEWKAKWQQADAAKQDAVDKYNRLLTNYDDVIRALKIANQKLAFLLDHCPFWVRWMYRKQFEKGGN